MPIHWNCICFKKQKQNGKTETERQNQLNRKSQMIGNQIDAFNKRRASGDVKVMSKTERNTLELWNQLQMMPAQLSEHTYNVCLPSVTTRDYTATDFFQFHEIIGTGITSVVFRATFKPDGSVKAIKYIPDFRQYKFMVMNELAILKVCTQCRFTCNLHSSFKVNKALYCVMDYYEGGDLTRLLHSKLTVPAAIASIFIKDVCRGILYMHKLKIAHRDINPNNIVVGNDGHLRLIDFSCGKVLKSRHSGYFTDLGNPSYKAPEVYLAKPCTMSVDWWAVGILLYRFLTGTTPYQGDSSSHRIMKGQQPITQLQLKFPAWAFPSVESMDFCERLARKNPKHRLGHSDESYEKEEHSIQSHPYLASSNWEEKEDMLEEILGLSSQLKAKHKQLLQKLINLPDLKERAMKNEFGHTYSGLDMLKVRQRRLSRSASTYPSSYQDSGHGSGIGRGSTAV